MGLRKNKQTNKQKTQQPKFEQEAQPHQQRHWQHLFETDYLFIFLILEW